MFSTSWMPSPCKTHFLNLSQGPSPLLDWSTLTEPPGWFCTNSKGFIHSIPLPYLMLVYSLSWSRLVSQLPVSPLLPWPQLSTLAWVMSLKWKASSVDYMFTRPSNLQLLLDTYISNSIYLEQKNSHFYSLHMNKKGFVSGPKVLTTYLGNKLLCKFYSHPSLQMAELRHREVNYLPRSHIMK